MRDAIEEKDPFAAFKRECGRKVFDALARHVDVDEANKVAREVVRHGFTVNQVGERIVRKEIERPGDSEGLSGMDPLGGAIAGVAALFSLGGGEKSTVCRSSRSVPRYEVRTREIKLALGLDLEGLVRREGIALAALNLHTSNRWVYPFAAIVLALSANNVKKIKKLRVPEAILLWTAFKMGSGRGRNPDAAEIVKVAERNYGPLTDLPS